ncbi:hypothetical protein Btru_067298 [Bulinus truncatus]|nr:hypothetical protein Btru_067298 [Bulinus truncatus]
MDYKHNKVLGSGWLRQRTAGLPRRHKAVGYDSTQQVDYDSKQQVAHDGTQRQQNGKRKFSVRDNLIQDNSLSRSSGVNTLVEDGYGAWIQDRGIEIMSAIYDLHHPNKSQSHFVLLSFLRHSSNRKFVCCFRTSLESEYYEQVSAELDYIDLRFIVDLQNAVFTCQLKNSHRDYKYVTFAPESCSQNISSHLTIVYPVPRSWELAVCTKLAYSKLDPVHLVEWFEYMKLVGVSKVLTFYNNINPDSLKVFHYYISTGFLELISYKPRSLKGFIDVTFTDENSQTRQARQDKTLLVRDCQHRLGGYDYVMTVDFDELPVPIRPYGTINWIIMELLLNFPDASGFRMDPILMPPEWTKPRAGGLYHWQFDVGTYIPPYCRKWIYLPKRTWLASTHENIPKKGYKTYVIPSTLLHFLHFRSCKSEWHDIPCTNLSQTVKNERVLERFGYSMYDSLKKLPLKDLIPNSKYVDYIKRYSKGTTSNQLEGEDPLEMLLQ